MTTTDHGTAPGTGTGFTVRPAAPFGGTADGTSAPALAGTSTSRTPDAGQHRVRTAGTNVVPATPATAVPPAPVTEVPPARTGTSPAEIEAALTARLREIRTAPVTATGTSRRRRDRTDEPEVPTSKIGRFFAGATEAMGNVPLAAALLASGWYTFGAFHDPNGLGQPWPIAILMVLALEGVVFRLAKLYELRLVAGHSTLADRLGIMAVVGAIGSVIYWHASQVAAVRTEAARAEAIKNLMDPDQVKAIATDWRAAAVAASLSGLAVFLHGRIARWKRRRELEAAGRVDMQALRIGLWMWIVSPWDSAWSFRHGMKYRIPVPADAVRDWRLWKDSGKPKLWPPVLTAGTDGRVDQVVPVPATILAELLDGTTQIEPVGTPSGTGTSVKTPAPTRTAGTSTRTGQVDEAGTAAEGTGTSQPPMGGTEPAEIAALRARNAARLAKICDVLDGSAPGAGQPDWRTIPETDLTLSLITNAGGFKNKTDAGQCKTVLIYDRNHSSN